MRLIASALQAAAAHLLHRLPIRLWRMVAPKSVIGICYHAVSDATLLHLKHYPYLNQAAFEADLDYLQRNYRTISYSELAHQRRAPHPARRNEAILTFDDGFAECATVIAPVLRRRSLTAIFFVTTDLIDNASIFRESLASLCINAVGRMKLEEVCSVVNALELNERLRAPPRSANSSSVRLPLDLSGLAARTAPQLHPLLHWLLTLPAEEEHLLRPLAEQLGLDTQSWLHQAQPYLTKKQIQQLHLDGFTIGAHSQTHRWLQSLPPEEAAREIVESCRVVRSITGQQSVPFAFPYFGGNIDRAWLAELRRQNDCIGLFFDTDGLREDVPFVVQRVFGERFAHDRTLDSILRRAWSRPAAWRHPSAALHRRGIA
jgi:peptidoglycan/xylan/chitin deacetylase (PgdA/CDA1 family)